MASKPTAGKGTGSFTPTPSNRPEPVWHPVPLSEVAMLAGLIALVVGLATKQPLTMAVGAGVMALGVLELTLREHAAGYRRHTLILAALTVVVVHTLAVLVVPVHLVGLPLVFVDLAGFAAGYTAADRLWIRGRARRLERG